MNGLGVHTEQVMLKKGTLWYFTNNPQ